MRLIVFMAILCILMIADDAMGCNCVGEGCSLSDCKEDSCVGEGGACNTFGVGNSENDCCGHYLCVSQNFGQKKCMDVRLPGRGKK